MTTLTIAILTLNEEKKIGKCITSASFANQIIVMDSGSTDNTLAIAKNLNTEVYIEADWQGFATQRNRVLTHATSEYIFFLDADEEITEQLQKEIVNQINSGEDAIWEVEWEQIAYGQSLHRMKTTGAVQRLFKRASLKHFEGVVHEGAVMRTTNIPVKKLQNRLLHYSRETVYGSILKLAQYAQLGAYKRKTQNRKGGILRGMASGLWIFIRLYFFRRGFLCGGAGFLFCFFIALECFFRYAALKYDSEYLTTIAKR